MKAKSFLPTTIVISLLLLQLTFAAPPRYEIIDLGTLGGRYSYARAINDAGQIVGWSDTADGFTLAFLWDPVNGMIDLGTLDGQYSKANSINRDGQIVGQAYNASGYWRATMFHLTGEGNNIDLGTLGGDRSFASSINDNGQIVGCAQITSGELHATLFDPTGGKDNIDLGTLGGDESWASSINNSSQIVGTAYRLFTSSGGRLPPVTSSYPRATLFDPTGQGNNIDLGTLLYTYGVCCCSGAMSINDSGHIVGAAWNEDPFPFGQEMAVLFDPTGGENNIFLGTLGRYGSFAYSINNRDQIIGWGGFCSNNFCGTRPALFDPTGQGNNVNLYDLIDPCCGWILKEVWSINDSGWIVGEGINPAGKHHAFLMKPIPPKVICVDDDATGNNDGSSWADAFNFLQDALAAAYSGDEIRVAQGIYKPDQGAVVTPGDREATFQLINGVTLKGGYAGAGAPDPNARDIELYETILTGDLGGNDVEVTDAADLLYEETREENSFHVVTGSGTSESAVLDGFTITAGNANAAYRSPHGEGGGMYNNDGSPTVNNCTFTNNSARYGGGMYNYKSSPSLTDCTFNQNSAGRAGGMFNCCQSNPTLTSCTFIRNSANQGGGMESEKSAPTLTNCSFRGNKGFSTCGSMTNLSQTNATLTNCIFSENSASKYAGIFNSNSNLTMTNCSFIGNTAERHSGGMYNLGSTLILSQCLFSGNSSSGSCGAILTRGSYHRQSNITLTNCTFFGNSGIDGNSLVFDSHSSCPPSIVQLTNCILWDGENPIWNNDASKISITYSNVQCGWPGLGNIDADPCFVQPGYWDANGVWVDGDYHLLPDSPCIDTGDPNYIEGPNETDLDGRPRVIGGRIDMGAYEMPIPAEARILPRTINLASKGNWIACYIRLPEGYNVADIDTNSVLLEDEIKPEQFSVDEQKQVATATFDREKVQGILNVGDIELKITGQLTDGTVFEATDVIKVTDKAGGKSK